MTYPPYRTPQLTPSIHTDEGLQAVVGLTLLRMGVIKGFKSLVVDVAFTVVLMVVTLTLGIGVKPSGSLATTAGWGARLSAGIGTAAESAKAGSRSIENSMVFLVLCCLSMVRKIMVAK